jgi:eukaryotic-like serine/threonine-protein kinase
MKEFILFLKSKRFRIHLIISTLIGVLLLWISFKSLSIYTHHGETIEVPDFSNIKLEDLDRFIADKHLQYEIIDSVYDATARPGAVLKQDPEKKSSVKENRIVYLTVSSKLPPLVKMPNLVDASMRQALALIESYGLKIGKRKYRPDPCLNCVLEQTMKGKKIETSTRLPKGSVIDLVLGQGQDGEKINTPCLVGLTQAEALEKIAQSGFSEGSIICNDCKTKTDKEKAKVYKQNPACSSDNNMLNLGSAIDIYLSTKIKMSADSNSYDQ